MKTDTVLYFNNFSSTSLTKTRITVTSPYKFPMFSLLKCRLHFKKVAQRFPFYREYMSVLRRGAPLWSFESKKIDKDRFSFFFFVDDNRVFYNIISEIQCMDLKKKAVYG